MKDKQFQEGTIIKGRNLKEGILCKVLSEDMVMRGFQYKMGINEDAADLAMEGSCKAGLHFCLLKDIVYFLHYGNKLALLSVPDDEDVYVDIDKFRTHRLEIRKIMPFSEAVVWEYLCKNCVDITAGRNYALRSSAAHGNFEMVKYLHEHGADITADNNYAVRSAAAGGHLEVVRYLHQNGADITVKDNYAIKIAAANGHLETVKYLYENGTTIFAANLNTYQWAEVYGHHEVFRYLKENME